MHRVGENCVVILLYGILEILNLKQISVENFVIRQLYGICAAKYLVNDSLGEEVYELFHRYSEWTDSSLFKHIGKFYMGTSKYLGYQLNLPECSSW